MKSKNNQPSKKKTPTINNTTSKQELLKKFEDEYLDLQTFKKKPIHQDFLRVFAENLRAFADHEDSLRLDEYYHAMGMGKRDFYRFVEKYDFVRAARDYAKAKIAARREQGALKNKLNAAVVMKYQPLFDDEVKELEKWRAALKADALEQGGIKVVEIPAIACSCRQTKDADHYEKERKSSNA